MAFWVSSGSRLPIFRRAAAGMATVGLTLGLAISPTAVSAKPRPTLATVQRSVEGLEREAFLARTRYVAAVRAVRDSEARVAQATAAVAAAEAKLSRIRVTIGELVAANYRSGGANALLRLLLAEDPETLLQSADWVEQSAEYQVEALRRVAAVKADVDSDRRVQQQALVRLKKARAESAAQRKAVERKATQIRALLRSLQPSERTAAARTALTATSAPAQRPSGGSCPPSGSRGAEARLTSATLSIMRCGLAAFPQIQFAGGWGTRGNATDHDDGRAVDFMIPNYSSAAGNDLGWAVAEWATKQPNMSYVLFDQMSYGSWDRRWKPMSNRGSDTANHRDHVHVSVTQ